MDSEPSFEEIKQSLSELGMGRLLQVLSTAWNSTEPFAFKQALLSAVTSFDRAKTEMLSKNWGDYDSDSGKFSLNFKDGEIDFPDPVNGEEEIVTFKTSDGKWTPEGTFDFTLGYRAECRKCECEDATKVVYSISIVDHQDGTAKEIEIKGEAECGTAYCTTYGNCKPQHICSFKVRAEHLSGDNTRKRKHAKRGIQHFM